MPYISTTDKDFIFLSAYFIRLLEHQWFKYTFPTSYTRFSEGLKKLEISTRGAGARDEINIKKSTFPKTEPF